MQSNLIYKRETNTSSQNPLDIASAMFESDMRAVNAIIIERMQSDVPLVSQLAAYLIAAGGKRIRPLMTLASTALLGGDMTRAHNLAACVEFIHTATLLHDDVVDESDERRGKATANIVFGNQASVLVGDFLFSRAFQMMVDDGSLPILKILSDASAIIAQGEVMQLSMMNNLDTNFDQYLAMIKAKTAALFAAACEVGPVIAGSSPDIQTAMAAYGLNMGIAFQIADDVLDYAATREKLGKTIGDDFREGKITAPILYALADANTEEKSFWLRTLGAREQNEGDLQKACEILQSHNALNKGLRLARDYAEAAVKALDILPPAPLRDLLCDIAQYAADRDY
jgi:octaprenyl-diphosphate synthase